MPPGVYERKPYMKTVGVYPYGYFKKYLPAMLACWAAGDSFRTIAERFGCSEWKVGNMIRKREAQG